jgi:hypothetical protein
MPFDTDSFSSFSSVDNYDRNGRLVEHHERHHEHHGSHPGQHQQQQQQQQQRRPQQQKLLKSALKHSSRVQPDGHPHFVDPMGSDLSEHGSDAASSNFYFTTAAQKGLQVTRPTSPAAARKYLTSAAEIGRGAASASPHPQPHSHHGSAPAAAAALERPSIGRKTTSELGPKKESRELPPGWAVRLTRDNKPFYVTNIAGHDEYGQWE